MKLNKCEQKYRRNLFLPSKDDGDSRMGGNYTRKLQAGNMAHQVPIDRKRDKVVDKRHNETVDQEKQCPL